jgi:pimeloyl-ACP methyl ester carboxylesterase
VPEFQRNGYVSYYEEAGSGEPLVLICGLSADLTVWRLLLPELAKHFRVVSLDNRGAGRSSAPDEPYTIQGMADDAIALLDHLQIAAANVLGWSMGGVIAQSIALARPEMVKRLVLLGSFAPPDGMFKNAIRN